MALSYGFYNSVNGDRTYDSVQLGQIFDGIIKDGVYGTYLKGMVVKTSSNSGEVIIQPGRAWFNHTWSYNDANLVMTAPDPDVLYERYDALVLDINSELSARENKFAWVQGTPSAKPKRPTLTHTTTHNQYALCYIHRYPETTTIQKADITNVIGTSETPFVTGVLKGIDLDMWINQWDDEFHTWETNTKTAFTLWETTTKDEFEGWMQTQQTNYDNWYEAIQDQMTGDLESFNEWFERIQGIIDEEAATHLQSEIDELAAMLPAGSYIQVTTSSTSLRLRDVTVSDAQGHAQTVKFDNTGVAVFDSFPYVGTLTITASDGTQTATGMLSTPYFGRYSKNIEFWSAKVNITADSALSGKVVTVTDASGSGVGSVTLNASGKATWYASTSGKYTFSITSGGQTMSQTVNVTQETTYTVSFTPVGATATPTDDIQTWLHCANIWNKNYTTLAQVLADSTTLQTLIASSNAVDYMVRSTSFCDDGQNLVPAMTGYTTPSGEVLTSTDNTDFPAWQAFDGTAFKTGVISTIGYIQRAANKYIGYHFTQPVVLKKIEYVKFRPCNDTYVFEASNDGSTYTALATKTDGSSVNRGSITSDNTTAYSYYRLRISSVGSISGTTTFFNLIRFFKMRTDVIQNNETAMTYIGLNDYCATKLLKNATWADALIDNDYQNLILTSNPYMTSNSAPSGTSSAQSTVSGYPAWQAFDDDASSCWAGVSTSYGKTATRWVQYMFTEATVLKNFTLRLANDTDRPTQVFNVQGSNDGSTFTTLYTKASGTSSTSGTQDYDLPDNNTAYKYYRVNLTQKFDASSGSLALPRVYNIRFWVRRYTS